MIYRRVAICLIAGVAAGLFAVPTHVSAITWGAVRDVSLTGRAASWTSSTATFGSTGIAVVYREIVDDTYRVFFRRSGNAGLTWKPPAQLSTPAAAVASRPAIASAGGRLYAVWAEGDALTDVHIMYSRTDPHAFDWSTPVRMSPLSEPAGFPAISASGSGQVAVAWTNNDTGRVYVRTSPHGLEFAFRRIVGSSSYQPFAEDGDFGIDALPAMVISADRLGLAFMSNGSTLRYRSRRSVFGETWQPARTLASNAVGAPDLTAYRRTFLVGYTIDTGTDLLASIRRSGDAGRNWSSPIAIGIKQDLPSFLPVISVRRGAWRAVYTQCVGLCDGTAGFYRASPDGGRTWGAKSRVTPGLHTFETPTGVGFAGRPFVIFNSGGDRPSTRVLCRRAG